MGGTNCHYKRQIEETNYLINIKLFNSVFPLSIKYSGVQQTDLFEGQEQSPVHFFN